jgi:MscS family membrane protein
MLQLPDTAYTILTGTIQVFGTFAAVWAAWRFTDLISEILMDKALKTDNKFDDVLVPLVRKTVKIFIVAFGLIYGAQSLHINVIPLITGLGIGGLAFAFAAKDTIENFFGSIAVILDRPFEVGDWVNIGGTEGTVIELGFRSTRIRTFYDSLITVPNAVLVRATVDNYGKRRYRRWKTYIGVQYDTPPEKMVQFVEGIRQLIKEHPHTRKDYFHVYYNQFGPSSLDILLYVFHEVPDWSIELQERERLFIDIVKLAAELGVSFAFPTQTIHLAKDDPSPEITINFAESAQKQIEQQKQSPQRKAEGDGRAYT